MGTSTAAQASASRSLTPVAKSTFAEGPLLCPREAATLLSVKPSWIYEAVRAHRIPCVRVGRHIRFTRAMLERWLAEQVDG
jgi:excisionase family DNA binding protein